MKRPGRNDPCPCGSGKKFKKCCESTMLRGKFKVEKIDKPAENPATIQKAMGLSALFHSHLSQTPKKPMPPSGDTPLPSEGSDPKVEGKGEL